MDKEMEEIPIELYATRNGEFIKYVKYEDYIELQQRIDKAVEYIEESIKHPMYSENIIADNDGGKVENLDKLLNILKGEDTK